MITRDPSAGPRVVWAAWTPPLILAPQCPEPHFPALPSKALFLVLAHPSSYLRAWGICLSLTVPNADFLQTCTEKVWQQRHGKIPRSLQGLCKASPEFHLFTLSKWPWKVDGLDHRAPQLQPLVCSQKPSLDYLRLLLTDWVLPHVILDVEVNLPINARLPGRSGVNSFLGFDFWVIHLLHEYGVLFFFLVISTVLLILLTCHLLGSVCV